MLLRAQACGRRQVIRDDLEGRAVIFVHDSAIKRAGEVALFRALCADDQVRAVR